MGGLHRPPHRLTRAHAGNGNRWDAVLVASVVLDVLFVWRLQDLYPLLGRFNFPLLFTLAATAMFMLDRHPMRTLRRIHGPILTWTLALLLLAALSVPWSLLARTSFMFVFREYSRIVLLMVLMAASIRHFRDVRRLMSAHVLVGGLYCLTVVVRGSQFQVFGYYDGNDLSVLLVLSLPLVIHLVIVERRLLLRLLMLASGLLFLYVTIRTGSRGGFVGLVAVAVYCLVFMGSLSKRVRIGVAASGVAAMLMLGTDEYWRQVESIARPSQDYNWSGQSETGRMEVWKRGVGYMLDHPFFGVGANAFGVAEGRLSEIARRRSEVGEGFKWSAAHNAYIQIGAELGVFGLILFLARLGYAVRITSRRRTPTGVELGRSDRQTGQAVTGALLGFAIGAFFLSLAYTVPLHFLLALAIGVRKSATTLGVVPRPRPIPVGRLRPVALSATGRQSRLLR